MVIRLPSTSKPSNSYTMADRELDVGFDWFERELHMHFSYFSVSQNFLIFLTIFENHQNYIKIKIQPFPVSEIISSEDKRETDAHPHA